MADFFGKSTPSHSALEFKQQRVSYEQLTERAQCIAAALQARGVEPGDRVAFLGRNSHLYFLLLYGCAVAGAIFVPLNWRLAPDEIEEILGDCAPRMVFLDREFEASIKPTAQGPASLIPFSMDPSSGAHDLDDTLNGESSPRRVSIDGEDVVVLLYTSGTTGRAKGVKLSHRALLAPRAAEYELGEWTHWKSPEDRLVAVMPLFHIACLSSAMMAFFHGCTVLAMDQTNPELLLDAISERRVTQGCIVPTLLYAMLQSPRIRSVDLSSLRTITYGGSPIAPETLLQLLETFGCNFAQGYGMTEVAGSCIFLEPDDHDVAQPKHLLSIGKPGTAAQLDIRDIKGDPVPDGEIGEIWIDSVALMTGYWQRPEEDAAVMRGRWYRSGDAGYRDVDGYFYLTDRIKDMIVTGAENVYPAEVERAMLAHPALLEVAVIAVPHDKWGEAVHAIAALKPGREATAEEILQFTRSRIAGFKVPKTLDIVAALPRNAFGKVPKHLLREPFWAGRRRRIN